MESKDKFLMLTKEQKRSGRIYLTQGQFNFLTSLSKSKDVEVISSPLQAQAPSGLTELKVYDDSNDRFNFSFDLTMLMAYKITMHCKQNKLTYAEFFKELLKSSPADQIVPETTTTVREQISRLNRHRDKDMEMSKIGLVNSREADILLGGGRGSAVRGVHKKMLKSTRIGSLHYFDTNDLEKYGKTIKKRF
jgi:hypothetical protein